METYKHTWKRTNTHVHTTHMDTYTETETETTTSTQLCSEGAKINMEASMNIHFIQCKGKAIAKVAHSRNKHSIVHPITAYRIYLVKRRGYY